MSLLLVVLMIATLFTGCRQEDKELVEALIKTQEILSFESTNDMAFNLRAEGLDEESQVMFDAIASQINNMKLSLKQKSVANKDQTVAKAQIDANVLLNDMNFDTSIWVDMDMNGDKLVLKEFFKLPSMLMSFIPGAVDKEYIVLDFDTMNQAMGDMEEDMPGQMDLDKTMAIAMKYQEKFKVAIVDYMKSYKFNDLAVTKLEDQIVNDEKIKYYQVAFDNDSFKEFLKYTTISMLQDENLLPLFEEYMTELMSAAGEELPEELSLVGKSTEMIEKVKTFFEKIEDLTILGEDGILITFGINEDGYFVSEAGNMNFLIDTNQWINLIPASMKENEALESMPTPVFELSISYDSKMDNINEDVEVTMPTTTEENAIDYMDLIKSMIPEVQQDNY